MPSDRSRRRRAFFLTYSRGFYLLTHFSFRIFFVCYRLMILIKAFKSYNPCLFGKHHTVIRKFFSAYLFKSL